MHLDDATQLKIDVMFDGVRYTDALAKAAETAYPSYYPYRFEDGEPNPTGKSKVPIPYLMTTPNDTHLRLRGNGRSPWSIERGESDAYRLVNGGKEIPVQFEPRPVWLDSTTSDGFPMAQAGVSLHADMAVINVAPGCEFFLHKENGRAMRCSFCSYGAPDERTAHLGQEAGRVDIPAQTLARMQEALQRAVKESEVRHIYLVGGSLIEPRLEADRFLQLARSVREVNDNDIPVTLGSGALPADCLEAFHRENLVSNICFNLEVWSEALFDKVCPGKSHYIGYGPWIESLEHSVSLWGRERVYSAMVAGIELEPEHGFEWEAAADLAIAGAEDLCSRGIIPIYSLYWPVGGKNRPDYLDRLRNYFERLQLAYGEIRQRHGLKIWDGFMCHRCAYMQVECDLDRALADEA
jgi:hypothetical protein